MKNLDVPFCETVIQAMENDGQLYVSMRPICKNIGLQWGSQYNCIMRDEVLKSVVFIMKTTAIDGKKMIRYFYHYQCLMVGCSVLAPRK